MEKRNDKDPYLGIIINGTWKLEKKIGSGKKGSVYVASRQNPDDTIACKVMEGMPSDGWDRELQKVTKLRGVESVVQYHSHGTQLDNTNKPFVWILWNDLIDGINLRTYLEDQSWPLDMAFIENLAEVILNVLYACHSVDVIHGDLHPGNILISNPDTKTIDKKRKIWVADFGYGGSHNAKKPKDDFKQLTSIVLILLGKLQIHSLNKRDRIMHEKLKFFFSKRFTEVDPTQGNHVGNIAQLITDFRQLKIAALQEAESTNRPIQSEPGDYLWAEAIGDKANEWKNLFVPEFLAAKDLLNKNITVLTGARGCGKTMAFKRLTVYMDKIIGESSGVSGSEEFIGFYVNCRNLIEAFPWIPDNLNRHIQAQIIHYFHLTWLNEVCNSIYSCFSEQNLQYHWLSHFILQYFPISYQIPTEGEDTLVHIMSFLESEKEKCRSTEYNKRKDAEWELYKMDFLDKLRLIVSNNTPWSSNHPFYFFLDDYTIPIIPRSVQQTLNPIIFKRRDNLFFKISTESFLSFERTSIRGKPLELHQDFELIDLANESLHQDAKQKKQLLERIFKPRIERHSDLKQKGISLEKLLGQTPYSSNELAWIIRKSAGKGPKKRIVYHGIDCFVGMWSSDVRLMIQMFVDLIRKASSDIEKGNYIISEKIQNDVYRTSGGEFLVFAESVPSPASLENNVQNKRNSTYGKHLIKIVEAFLNISRYELINGELIQNQKRQNPKQAFRLEIIDKFELLPETKDYYEGLVRWHIFLHDWRGKSVRGMYTPRLFMNRVLIPNSQLTFSSHDNIHMSSQEFNKLLKDPTTFLQYWKLKRRQNRKYGSRDNQSSIDF